MKLKINMNGVLLGFIFLYPITPWYITIGSVNLVNILAIFFVAFWFSLSGSRWIASFKGTSVCFWLYLVVYSIQALIDSSFSRSIAYIVAQLVVCIILFTEARKRNIFEQAIDMLIYAAAFLSVMGIFEEVTHINIFHLISGLPISYFYTETRLGIYRIETSFSHPIVYCAYLCIIAGLITYRMNALKGNSKVRIYRVFYFLVLINAVFTMSRSALVVLIAEQIVIGYQTGIIKFSKKMGLIALIALFALVMGAALRLPIIMKLQDLGYMFLAMFDDSYSNLYSTAFGMNKNAVGNRLELYTWVADAVEGHELFGMGTAAKFAYDVQTTGSAWNTIYTWTKTSIENEYLYNYYIHGIIGVISFSMGILGSILYSIKVNKKRKSIKPVKIYNEAELTFSKVMIILLIGYAATLFSVRSSDNVRMYNVLMCLMFGYYYSLRNRKMEWRCHGKEVC